jgi:hypothetical protein
MVDIVIASSGDDETLVEPIAEQLRLLGLDVSRSEFSRESANINAEDPGEKQIAKSGAVLVCWSDSAVSSQSVLAAATEGLWQQKLTACRLAPCVPPPSFASVPISDLQNWAGRIYTPAWKNVISAIAEKLHRPGVSELLRARISGDESDLYSFARRFPDEPQAREIWAAFEAKYREECASALRDARRYFEQRAESHQEKVETLLKSFANDFQLWLERERRGEDSPKPSLNTLREIWLKRETPQQTAKVVPEASSSAAVSEQRQARIRAEEAAKIALLRAEQAETELAKTRVQLDELTPSSRKPELARQFNPIWKPVVLVVATLSSFGLGMMARPNLRESTVRVPEIAIPSDQAGARAPDQQSSEAASRRGVQRTSDEILTNLLTTRRDETLSRVIGDDPHAALSKLLELSPEDVVKTSASKLPNLAVDEALKASASQAMAPIAQLPARDVFKALESAMSPEKIAELAKLFPKTESPTDGANYKTFDNLDIESSSVIKLKNSGLQSCVSVCRQKENCKAYTFDKWNHVCYIKSKIGDFKLNPRSSSGIRDDVQHRNGALSSEGVSRLWLQER